MPALARTSGSPMPDNCNRCGEPTAPAARITSHAASARSIEFPRPAIAGELDTDRAAAFEDHAMYQRAGHNLQVGSLRRRLEIGARGAGPAPPAAGLLAPADAVAGTRRQIVYVG